MPVGDEITIKPTDQTSGSTSGGSGSAGGNSSGSTGDTNGERLINNDNPANSSFAGSTASSTNNASSAANAVRERSLSVTETEKKTEKEPEVLSAQELAVREVRRILGGRDAEAEFAAGSRAAGGFVNTTEAAVTSIVNTNANNLTENPELQARVAEAAAAAKLVGLGNMINHPIESHGPLVQGQALSVAVDPAIIQKSGGVGGPGSGH
jgi:hypothetical protein